MITRPGGLAVTAIVLLAIMACEAAAQRVVVDAVAGRPLGVGRIRIRLSSDEEALRIVETNAFALHEQDDRVLYPALETSGNEVVNGLLGLLLEERLSISPSVTAYFLFRGEGRLKLDFQADDTYTIDVTPRYEPRAYSRLMRRWWRHYTERFRRREKTGDYPPAVEMYLANMLSQRLGLFPPAGASADDPLAEPQRSLELLLGTERLRYAVMRDTLESPPTHPQQAVLPLPRPIRWPQPDLPEPAVSPDIEAIALRVPEECFYVRFGNFANYMWFTHLLDDYGGDIAGMVRLRGQKAHPNERFRRQIALRESALADLLGGQIIADVALIGRDMFQREGAAMGILFEAKNEYLNNDITNQRNAALQREKENGATLQTVQIAGRDVSYLSTPDNQLRSFHAVDGNYHLVTTSREIVERFFEVGGGQRSLGESIPFIQARRAVPLSREDTVFIYLSSQFFQGLASPRYQIELRRRMKAATDIELVKMARWASKAESKEAATVDRLIAAGLLPRAFNQRADGSRVVLDEAQVVDSLRGAPGSFLPITDVELSGITPEEAERWADLARFLQDHWKHADPMILGVKRNQLDQKGMERVTIEAWMLPFDAQQYGLITSLIGPPTDVRVTGAPDDIVSIQAVLKGGMLRPSLGPHHLFLRVQDMAPRRRLPDGPVLRALHVLTTAPGYLGAWPQPGLLDLLPGFVQSEPDVRGYSRLPLGLWRRQLNGFSVLSFLFPVLESVTPQLRVEPAENSAQFRIRVGDLSRADLSAWVNELYYKRANQISVGNARLLHALSQQLRVPREEALAAAEDLMDVQLVCPLGGEYQLQRTSGGLSYWTSTAWDPPEDAGDARFQATVLDWFRGLRGDATMHQDKLFVQAELDMQRKERAGPLQLPFLKNLFGDPQEVQPDEDELPPEVAPPIEPLPEPLPPPPPTADRR